MGQVNVKDYNPTPVKYTASQTVLLPPAVNSRIDEAEIKRALREGVERKQQEDIAHDRAAAAYLHKTVTPQLIVQTLFDTVARDPRSSFLLLSLDRDRNIRGNSPAVKTFLGHLAQNKWIAKAEANDDYQLRYITLHFAPAMVKALRAFADDRDPRALSAYLGETVNCAPAPSLPPPSPALASLDLRGAVAAGLKQNEKNTNAQEQRTAAYLARTITPATLHEALVKTLTGNPDASYILFSLARDMHIERQSPALQDFIRTLKQNDWIKDVTTSRDHFVTYLSLEFTDGFRKSLRNEKADATANANAAANAAPLPAATAPHGPAPRLSFLQRLLARLRPSFFRPAPPAAPLEAPAENPAARFPGGLQNLHDAAQTLTGVAIDTQRLAAALTVAHNVLVADPALKHDDYRLAAARLTALADHFRQYAALQAISGKPLPDSDAALLRNAFETVAGTFENINDKALATLSESARLGLLVLDLQNRNQPRDDAPQIPAHNQKITPAR